MFRFLRRIRYRLFDSLAGAFHALFSPVRALQSTFRGGIRMLANWWHTREMRDLLYGLPALLVLIGATAVVSASLMNDNSRVRQQYRSAADDAFAARQYAPARLLYQRAIQEGEANSEVLFRLARCCEELKDFAAMEAIVSQLAPLGDDPKSIHLSYAPAHLRQAVKLLQGRPLTPESLKAAEEHLLEVVALDKKNDGAHRLLGEMYFQQGKWSEAIVHLKEIVKAQPQYYMVICRAYSNLNDSRAIGYAQEGRDIFTSRINAHPEVVDNYTYAGDACMLLGDYRQAAEYLVKGLEIQPDNMMLRYGLGRTYVQWGASLKGETRQEREVQLELFSNALTINPDESLVYNGLVNILQAKDETSLQAEEFLTAHMAEGKSVGLCHLLLATLAESRGDLDQCELHLTRAFDLMPQAAVIANNLSWILATKESPEPERALTLIDRALEQSPDEKRFLDTRGQIYTKLGNWEAAVKDLERTMPEFGNNPKTHEALAKCYDQLGDKLLAEQHRRLSGQEQVEEQSPEVAPPVTEQPPGETSSTPSEEPQAISPEKPQNP